MPTTKDFRDFVTDQLSIVDDITCRPMMGEYLLYCDGILFGGIYDGRLLVKIVASNQKYHLPKAIPYKGARAMYQIEDLDDQDALKAIVLDTCKDLPAKKKS